MRFDVGASCGQVAQPDTLPVSHSVAVGLIKQQDVWQDQRDQQDSAPQTDADSAYVAGAADRQSNQLNAPESKYSCQCPGGNHQEHGENRLYYQRWLYGIVPGG